MNLFKPSGPQVKEASWFRMLNRAIAKLPAQSLPFGSTAYRGLNLAAGQAFNGVRHGTIRPELAAGYARQNHLQFPLLQTFRVDPKTQKHFVEFGLLEHLRHPLHDQFGIRSITNELPGRTLSAIAEFVKKNPISSVSRNLASPNAYPDWFDALGFNFRSSVIKPGMTVQRGLQGSRIDPKRIEQAMYFETPVTANQFSGLAAYDPTRRKVIPLPQNIVNDFPNVKSATTTAVLNMSDIRLALQHVLH